MEIQKAIDKSSPQPCLDKYFCGQRKRRQETKLCGSDVRSYHCGYGTRIALIN